MTNTLKTLGLLCLLVLVTAGGARAQTLVTNGLVRQYDSGSGTFQNAAKTIPDTKQGQSIATWADQSASPLDLTQTTAANDPVYQLYQFGPQPGVFFGGGNIQFNLPIITASSITIVSAQKVNTGNTSGTNFPLFSNYNSDGSGGFLLQVNNSTYRLTEAGGGEQGFGTTSYSSPDVTTLALSPGASPIFRLNGTDISPSMGGYHAATAGTFAIGSNPYNGGGANFVSGGVLIYNRVLTTAEMQQDELYLSNKYYGLVPGTTHPSAGTPQTFPLSSVSRWGSWSTLAGSPLVTAMNSGETQLAFKFTGTKAEILLSQSTGNNPAANLGLHANIDGADFDVPTPASYASGQNWLTVASNLPDTVHFMVVSIATPYYNNAYFWGIDATTPVRISGANPACVPASYRTVPGGKIIVFEGDSRTYGFDASSQYGITLSGTTFPSDFMAQLNDSTWTGVNQGTYSELASAMLTREPGDVLTQFNPVNTRNVLVLFGGINDANSGVTQAALTQTLKSEITNARAKGVTEIIVGTLPYTGSNPVAQAYDSDLVANGLSYGATSIVDINSDPDFSGHVVNSFWNSDTLHMTDAGYKEIETDFYQGFTHQTAYAGTPFSVLGLSSISILSTGATFIVAPTGGTGPYTYTLTRPGMTAVTNTTGTLLDPSPAPGTLNLYTLSATDSEATPVTKTMTQTVVPLGAYTAPTGTYLSETLTHNSSGQPVLAWPPDPTATGYKQLRSADGVTYSVIATLPAGTLTYTDTAEPSGPVYYSLITKH